MITCRNRIFACGNVCKHMYSMCGKSRVIAEYKRESIADGTTSACCDVCIVLGTLVYAYSYLPSIPGFPGLSRVSASPPGIPGELGIIPGFSVSSGIPELVQIIPVQHSHVHIMCAQYSAVQSADRGEDLPYSWLFSRMKKHFREFFFLLWCTFWHDFRLDIRGFGQKCQIKGNKEKSRESGGSGQGKQPSGVGRYAYSQMTSVNLQAVQAYRMPVERDARSRQTAEVIVVVRLQDVGRTRAANISRGNHGCMATTERLA